MDRSIAIMERHGVAVERVRAVDHVIPPGGYPDMTEHGFERPALFEAEFAADILVIGTPIWLGGSPPCARGSSNGSTG